MEHLRVWGQKVKFRKSNSFNIGCMWAQEVTVDFDLFVTTDRERMHARIYITRNITKVHNNDNTHCIIMKISSITFPFYNFIATWNQLMIPDPSLPIGDKV